MTIDKKRLNEIVPVSHPIFWFGTILAQKSNNKNYSNNAKTNQVELISSCYHDIVIDPFYINRVKKLGFLSFFLVDCIVHDPCHKEIF